MTVWRFQKITESRWLTVGTSARAVVAAHLTGIEGLVQYIIRIPHASKFYLNGFLRLKSSRKEFLVVAAVASRVAEVFQIELMKDNRIARNHDDLWHALAQEVRRIVDLSPHTFSVLGSVCGLSGADVADRVIAAAHVSWSFLHRRVLAVAEALPWSLVRGDIAENLRGLAAEDMPEEPVSAQLWKLMRRSFNLRQLVGTVELLGEVGWTSLPAEQQHASLALLHKWHPEYGPRSLIARALMLQIMKLLPAATKAEKEKAAILRRMDKVMRAQPDRCSGMHMIVKSMISICKARKEDGQPGYWALGRQLAQQCLSRQAVMWAGMTIRQQLEWQTRAHMHAAERSADMAVEWQTLHAQLAEVEEKVEVLEGM